MFSRYLAIILCAFFLSTHLLVAQTTTEMIVDCQSKNTLRQAGVSWPKYTPEKFDGDTTRLIFNQSSEDSFVVIDAAQQVGQQQLRGFECLTYSFGNCKKVNFKPLILEVAMTDEPDAYQQIELAKSAVIANFPGGRTSQLYRTLPDAPTFRYIRLHMQGLDRGWKIALGQLRFSVAPMPTFPAPNPKPAKQIKKTTSKPITKSIPTGVTKKTDGLWFIDFDKHLPVTYTQANWSRYQEERYDGDATRIRFKKSEPQSNVIFDLQRLTELKQATDLQLAVYGFSKIWKTLNEKCIIEISNDGVNYQTIPTLQSKPIKHVKSGRTLVYLKLKKATALFRYIRVHLDSVKDPWQVGLTHLLVSDKPLKDFVSVFNTTTPTKTDDVSQATHFKMPSYQLPKAMRTPAILTSMQGVSFDKLPVNIDKLNFSKLSWHESKINPHSFYGVHWQIKDQNTNAQCSLYRLQIKITQNDLKDRAILVFPQTFFVLSVYLDGKEVASNRQGMSYTEVDLTDYLNKAGSHELVIKVDDYHKAIKGGKVVLPIGAQFRYRRGFARAPMLVRRAKTSMINPFIQTNIHEQKVAASVDFSGTVKKTDTLRINLLDLNDQSIFEQTVNLNGPQNQKIQFEVQDKLALWDIGKPNLYVCQFELIRNAKVIDTIRTRFGYRTISTRGEDILLNGRKIQLIGPWAHIGEWTRSRGWVKSTGNYASDMVKVYQKMLSHGINYGRLHCQIFDRIFYEAADEAGFLIVAESGLNHRPKNQPALDHIKQMTLQLRNHPSIVIWSGSNEFEHWITPRPAETENFMVNVQETYKQYDSTRLVMHSGYGDAQGKIDIYNIHYPDSGMEFPHSLYWKGRSDQFNHLYSDNYSHFPPDGKKPLAIGEQLTPNGRLNLDYVYGDTISFLRNGDPANTKKYEQYLAKFWKQAVRIYREQNVALLSPNMMYLDRAIDSDFLQILSEELKPQTVYWQSLDPALIPGKNTRDLAMFELSGHPFEGHAELSLTVNNQVLWKKRLPISLKASERRMQMIELNIPKTDSDLTGNLAVKLTDNQGKKIYAMARPVKVYAPIKSTALAGRVIYAINLPKTIQDKFRQWQIHVKTLETLAKIADLPAQSALLIGNTTASSKLQQHAQTMSQFVSQGGRMLMLARQDMPDIFPSQIKLREGLLNGATLGFIRSPHHAFFAQSPLKMDNLDLCFWGNDLLVSDTNCFKPISGNFHVLIDGGKKIQDTLLTEMIHGKGRMIACQLLLDKTDQAPAASKLLFNLTAYLTQPSSTPTPQWGHGVYLTGTQTYAANILSKIGFKEYQNTMDNIAAVYIDDASLSSLGATKVAKIAKHIRFVYLHVKDQKHCERITQALTASTPTWINTPKFKGKKRKPIHLKPAFTQRVLLFDGLPSKDINWFTRAQPQNRMFASTKHWQVPVMPGMFAIHRNDKQTILADISSWDQVVDDDESRLRFLCSLNTQMGVLLDGRKIRTSTGNTKIRSINLKPYCNVSAAKYLGKNMPQGNMQFSSIPFIFPIATPKQPHTMIRLNSRIGTDLEGKKILADTPIDDFPIITPTSININMGKIHASKIYFAHATTFNYKIKHSGKGLNVCQYRVLYTNGTQEIIPIRLRNEIQDTRKTYTSLRNLSMGTQFLNPENGDGELMAIGVYTWENPAPEKKIHSIELITAQNPHMDPMLFAISYGEYEAAFE